MKKEYTCVGGVLDAAGVWTETLCDGKRHITRCEDRAVPAKIGRCDCKDFVLNLLKNFDFDWPK